MATECTPSNVFRPFSMPPQPFNEFGKLFIKKATKIFAVLLMSVSQKCLLLHLTEILAYQQFRKTCDFDSLKHGH